MVAHALMESITTLVFVRLVTLEVIVSIESMNVTPIHVLMVEHAWTKWEHLCVYVHMDSQASYVKYVFS